MPSKSSKSLNNKFFDINDEATKTSNISYYFNLIAIIISLCINFFILYWLIKVEKCKCANIDEGLYLKEWYMFLIVYQILFSIYMIAYNDFEPSGVLYMISTIISLIAFVMIVRLLIYIHKLKEIKCDCGMSVRENIIYYFYIVGYSIALFIILLAILGTLFLHR